MRLSSIQSKVSGKGSPTFFSRPVGARSNEFACLRLWIAPHRSLNLVDSGARGPLTPHLRAREQQDFLQQRLLQLSADFPLLHPQFNLTVAKLLANLTALLTLLPGARCKSCAEARFGCLAQRWRRALAFHQPCSRCAKPNLPVRLRRTLLDAIAQSQR